MLSFFFFEYHFALVIELAFVPVRPVIKVGLARGRVLGDGRHLGFVMGAALIAAGGALAAFRMCHRRGY
jgi:hypothetical protein